MKKLLLFLALAAAGLQGWADDFYIVGNATGDGWTNSARTDAYKMTKDASLDKYTWTGILYKQADAPKRQDIKADFKICVSASAWAAWCASTADKNLEIGETTDTPIKYNDNNDGGNDHKWVVQETGYYEIILDLSGNTKSFKANLLVKANASGTCLIENATDLTEFRKLVNEKGMKSLNANLTGDIDMNDVTYTPIGTDTYKYAGTFDGNGYRIKNLIITGDTHKPGLFHVCASATIKNLIMDATCTITSNNDTGGEAYGGAAFVALANTDNNSSGVLTIENCGNEATVNGTAPNKAAFVGFNYNGSGTLTINISKCYNKGAISGGSDNCAFVGWNKSNSYTTTKCYNTGTIAEYHSEKNVWGRGDGTKTVTMCYGKNITGSDYNFSGNLVSISDDQVSSGELCYLLNGSSSGGTDWYQNLSPNAADAYPIPFSTHKLVYQNQATPSEVYSNYDIAMVNGKYQISDDDKLKVFSDLVNTGATSSNAELTDNITVGTGYTPIGSLDNKYVGEFDGKGKTITLDDIDNSDYSNQGVFGVVTGGANIHDLIVAGSLKAKAKVAGVIGLANGGGQVYLTNVINLANIRSTGDNLANAAGLVGCAANNTALIVTNCANMGNVIGQEGQCSGLAGWTEDYNGLKSLFINCWNSGTINNMENNCNLYRNTSKVDATNCYDVSGNGSYTQGTKLGNNTLASGELCYKLNGDQKEIGWYQNLIGTTDTYPVPFSSHSQVYPNAAVNCDGSSVSGSALGYTNTNTYSAPAHNYEDGWCTICNAYQENGITATNDWFEIGNAKQLRWMVESVNKHYNTYKSAKIKLTDDIDYSAYKNEDAMFGFEHHTYKGTFDGQCHAVTVDFEASESETGLFRRVNGGTIKNLKVEGNIETTKQFAGGIVAGIWEKGTITNCVSAVTLTDTNPGHDGTHGGILGWVNSVNDITVSNCLFIGEIDAPNTTGCTGVVGWTADKETEMKVKNCLVLGTLNLKDDATNGIIVRSKANTTGNYYICTVGSSVDKDGGTDASAHNNTPGELCYYINGSTPYNTEWRQNLGTTADDTPVPFYTHGIVNKISSVGYTTQYIPTTDVIIPAGVEAYAGVVSGESLSLRAINGSISKEDAVVLKGTANTYYSFVPTTGASEATSNSLQGSNGNVTGGANIYALAKLGEPATVGFYPLTDTSIKIPAGKAYLNTGAGVKGFTFVFDDDATSLSSISSPEGKECIYNLAGQRIQKMQKGINIVNGKKILK